VYSGSSSSSSSSWWKCRWNPRARVLAAASGNGGVDWTGLAVTARCGSRIGLSLLTALCRSCALGVAADRVPRTWLLRGCRNCGGCGGLLAVGLWLDAGWTLAGRWLDIAKGGDSPLLDAVSLAGSRASVWVLCELDTGLAACMAGTPSGATNWKSCLGPGGTMRRRCDDNKSSLTCQPRRASQRTLYVPATCGCVRCVLAEAVYPSAVAPPSVCVGYSGSTARKQCKSRERNNAHFKICTHT
jgi:hypothetical protein